MSSRIPRSHLSHLVRNVNATKAYRQHLRHPTTSSSIPLTNRKTRYHFSHHQQFHSSSSSGTTETSNGKVTDKQAWSLPAWSYPVLGLAGLGVFGVLYSKYKNQQMWKRGKEVMRDLGGNSKEGFNTSKEWIVDKRKKIKKKFKQDSEEDQEPSRSDDARK